MRMDELEANKIEIDMKLERETSNLALLKESLVKSNNMTKNMTSILETFNQRLRKLEDSITPVYQETGNLQMRQENIEKTILRLDHVISFYHIAKESDPIIRNGPSGEMENFLECMGKLQRAVEYFTEDNPGCPEFSAVNTLYDTGRESLEREFTTLLKRHSKPISPVTVLNMIGTDEEIPSNQRPSSICSGSSISSVHIEHLPDRVVDELVEIAKWLIENGTSTEFSKVYATVRSSNLMKSLHGLKDHLRKSSSGSSSHGAPHSPLLAAKMRGSKDASSRRTSKRVSVATLARKSTSLIRGSVHTLDTGGLKRQPSFSLDFKEEGTERDVEIYLNCITALLKLAQSEQHLMMRVLPESLVASSFDTLIQAGLDMIVNEGEQFAQAARKSIGKHEFSGVLSIFPVVKHLQSVKLDYEQMLEGCLFSTKSKLTSLMASLNSVGAKALESFIESIRNDPDKSSNMPKDGTVHELTNNVIIFLEQLMEFGDTAGTMLLSQDNTNDNSKKENRCTLKLADYITKSLSALNLNLSNKAGNTYTATLQAVFMLNNYNYILKSLKRSGLLDIVHMSNKDVERYFEDKVLEQMRLYSESWSRVLNYIVEPSKQVTPTKPQSPDAGKLKDKERQMIKDRFSGFNKEMDELFRMQKTYASPDPELRAKLTKDNKSYILPKYRQFWENHVTKHFSKTPEKYMKYTVDDVSYMIDQFFESE